MNVLVERMTELKPCPFCGGKAHIVIVNKRVAIECTQKCVATRILKNKEKLIELWNRRADNETD